MDTELHALLDLANVIKALIREGHDLSQSKIEYLDENNRFADCGVYPFKQILLIQNIDQH